MKRIFKGIAIGLMAFALFSVEQLAVSISTPEQLGVPVEASTQDENFGVPKTIIISPIFLESSQLVTDAEWYRGLYYYQKNRLSQGDNLFHYIVFSDGRVVKGNTKGEEQRIGFEGNEGGEILIGYLAPKGATDFSALAGQSIAELVLEISNRNAISPSSISTATLDYYAPAGEPVRLRKSILLGRWQLSVNEIINNISASYAPVAPNFMLELVSVNLPPAEVSVGQEVVVGVNLKNNSEFSLFGSSDFAPLASKTDNTLSKFYLISSWDGLAQVATMTEDDILRPGETKEFKFKVGVPLYFGEQNEQFVLKDRLGQTLPNSSFELKLNVSAIDQEVVEIIETGTGFLRVRASSFGSAEEVGRVSVGQRFIVLDRTDAGWVKIKLDNGIEGWVAVQYTRRV